MECPGARGALFPVAAAKADDARRTPLHIPCTTEGQENIMAIGLGIFLMVVGAVLAFAVNASVEAVNLEVVGWICMIAGAAAIVISLIVNAQSTRTTHREIYQDRPGTRPKPPNDGPPRA